MYKQKEQIEKYIWALYYKLVLFLQEINSFRCILACDIKGGVLG